MTTPHSRLLLATEHTEFDTGAERIALELARRRGVPLAAVVPIVSNIEYESVAPGLVARMEEDVHARLVALQDEAARAGVSLDVRVRRGEEPWREIVAEATARGADLIVIRRRGKRSFLANLMIGELVGKVATSAPCDVLMVPRAAPLTGRRVLAGVDGTPVGPQVARAAAQVAAGGRRHGCGRRAPSRLGRGRRGRDGRRARRRRQGGGHDRGARGGRGGGPRRRHPAAAAAGARPAALRSNAADPRRAGRGRRGRAGGRLPRRTRGEGAAASRRLTLGELRGIEPGSVSRKSEVEPGSVSLPASRGEGGRGATSG